MKKILTCAFKNSLEGISLMDIDDPKVGLTAAEIAEFMDTVIEGDIYISDVEGEESHLVSIEGAYLIQKVL